MFTNDFARYVDAFKDVLEEAVTGGEAVDAQARAGVTHVLDVVVPTLAPASGSTVYATKAEVVSGAGGGMLETAADLKYATKQEMGAKADTTEVTMALSNKANTLDMLEIFAVKADVNHHHDGVYQPVGNYAPAVGSTVYATKDEVTEATGGGLTQTTADGRYVQQTALFQGVTDITDPLYATQDHHHDADYAPMDHTHTQYALQTDLTTKADANHDHTGVYQPVGNYASGDHTHTQYAPITNPTNGQNNYAGKDYVDALVAGVGGSGSPTYLWAFGRTLGLDSTQWSSSLGWYPYINTTPLVLADTAGYTKNMWKNTSTDTLLCNIQWSFTNNQQTTDNIMVAVFFETTSGGWRLAGWENRSNSVAGLYGARPSGLGGWTMLPLEPNKGFFIWKYTASQVGGPSIDVNLTQSTTDRATAFDQAYPAYSLFGGPPDSGSPPLLYVTVTKI